MNWGLATSFVAKRSDIVKALESPTNFDDFMLLNPYHTFLCRAQMAGAVSTRPYAQHMLTFTYDVN